MPRTATKVISAPYFLADELSATPSFGGNIDWDAVPDIADYKDEDGNKILPSGTILKRCADETLVPHDSAKVGTVEGLLRYATGEKTRAHAKTGVGVVIGGVVYEELVPGLTPTLKDELVANGVGWHFRTYQNSLTA